MRIGIDARMMGASNTRGIGRYIEEMIRAMLGQLHEQETLVLFERDPSKSPISHPRAEHVKADIPWYGFTEQIGLPSIYEEAKFDILWVPHWNVPVMYSGPVVTTIHDLLLVNKKTSAKLSTKHPAIFWMKYAAFRFVLRLALAKSLAIFPPTEAIAGEIKAFDAASAKKLRVTGEGLGHIAPNARRPFNESYIFYIGSAYPHKRLDLALDAWKAISAAHLDLHFLVAGEKDVFMNRYEIRANEDQLPRIRFIGRLNDEELSAYLTHAEGLLFPSEYEGFGLPPLEALLCGTPVVAADIDVMKEVLPKDGVFFFHKGNVNDMIMAIESMLARGATDEEMTRARNDVQERHAWASAARIVCESIRNTLKKEERHDEKKEKTRGDSGVEEDEHQRRAGTSA